jgi:hypothetical protein
LNIFHRHRHDEDRSAFVRERRPAPFLSFTAELPTSFEVYAKDWQMTPTAKYQIAICIMLCAASPAHAGSCKHSITQVQAQVDAALEQNAGSHGWQPESLSATRSYQPTPRSLAAVEDRYGPDFTAALDSLERARDADRIGDMAACKRELARAQAVLR